MADSPLYQAAREYLAAGLSVIALKGKAPNGKWHPHGLLEPFTAGSAMTLAHFEPPTTGVGILIPSFACVADVDSDEAAAEMPSSPEWSDTAITQTAHGMHVWFFAPDFGPSRWVGKLLLRGKGSYVVAPPSLHPDGPTYEWLVPLVQSGRLLDLVPLPAELRERLAMDAITRDVAAVEHPQLVRLVIERGKMFSRPVTDRLVEWVSEAAVGERNNRLAYASLEMRDIGVSFEQAMSQLTEAATAAGLDAREIRTTVRSAYRRRRRET